jgi:hypothetical protein
MVENFFSYEKEPLMVYEKINQPFIFIGCVLKNLYDEERIKIKDEFNPKRILHCNRFLYGTLIDIDLKAQNILNEIQKFKSIDLFTYNKIISLHDLSCNENFIYFEDKMYPLDSKHIFNYLKKFKYSDFFEEIPEKPTYQQIKSINVFILTS